MRCEPSPMIRRACGSRGVALAMLLLGLAVGAPPVWAATVQPGPAAAASQPKAAGGKAAVKVKAKSGGSAPGSECGATSGVKVPTWPKCPGPDKVGAKAKQAGS